MPDKMVKHTQVPTLIWLRSLLLVDFLDKVVNNEIIVNQPGRSFREGTRCSSSWLAGPGTCPLDKHLEHDSAGHDRAK